MYYTPVNGSEQIVCGKRFAFQADDAAVSAGNKHIVKIIVAAGKIFERSFVVPALLQCIDVVVAFENHRLTAFHFIILSYCFVIINTNYINLLRLKGNVVAKKSP